MSTLRDLKEYRFATPAQWETGVLAKIRLHKDGELKPERPLAPLPCIVNSRGHGKTSAPAFDAYGVAYWLKGKGFLQWMKKGDDEASSMEAATAIANSPRLVPGRTWLWAFRRNGSCLMRYDLPSLQQDDDIPLEDGWMVSDIAADGADGVWLLASRGREDGGDGYALALVSANGCVGEFRELPKCFGRPLGIAYLSAAQRLALLNEQGTSIAFVDPRYPNGASQVLLAEETPGFSAERLSSDSLDRLLAVGKAADKPMVLLLDASGGVLDQINEVVLDQINELESHAPITITGAAAFGSDVVLTTTDKGILWFESKSAGDAKEAEGWFLTPPLHSPETYALRGWLRAELSAALPKGASLEVRVISTNDPAVRDEITAISRNNSLPPRKRQEKIAALEALTRTGPFHFVSREDSPDYAPNEPASPPACYAVPLFDHRRQDQWNPWLWLEVKLAAAPDGNLPELHELRVLYPEVSLAQHVPAIFRGDVTARDPKSGDPTGFFRKWLGLLETTTQNIDQTVSTLGSRIHPETAKGQWLDFVARWLDLPWDDALPERIKRNILVNADELLAWRGTRVGLERLLSCLFPSGKARVADVNVDYGLVTLGGTTPEGKHLQGSCLPAVLSGLPESAAVLSRQAVLGRARLSCVGDDSTGVSRFMGLLRIDIMAGAQEKADVESVLPKLLAEMTPAGLRTDIRWRSAASFGLAPRLDEGFALDDPGKRRLDQDAYLGLTILAGGRYRQLAESGLGLGFHL